MEKPTKTNHGKKRKISAVKIYFVLTIILSLAFSALFTWFMITDNLGGAMCTYVSVGRGLYFIVNDTPCILTAESYFTLVYFFFLAFLPLQLGTLGFWLLRKLKNRKR